MTGIKTKRLFAGKLIPMKNIIRHLKSIITITLGWILGPAVGWALGAVLGQDFGYSSVPGHDPLSSGALTSLAFGVMGAGIGVLLALFITILSLKNLPPLLEKREKKIALFGGIIGFGLGALIGGVFVFNGLTSLLLTPFVVLGTDWAWAIGFGLTLHGAVFGLALSLTRTHGTPETETSPAIRGRILLYIPFLLLAGMGSIAWFWSTWMPFSKAAETSGDQAQTLTGHTSEISQLYVSPDGHYMLSNAHDRFPRIWDLQTQKNIFTFEYIQYIHNASFSPDSQWLVITDGINDSYAPDISALRTSDWQEGWSTDICAYCNINALVFSDDSQLLAISACYDSEENYLEVWDIQENIQLLDLDGAGCPSGKLSFSSTPVPENPNQISYDLGEKGLLLYTPHHPNEEGKIASVYSDDDSLEVVATQDESELYTIVGVDTKTDTSLWTLVPDKKGWFYNLVISPDNRWLVFSIEEEFQIWDLETGTLAATLPGDNYNWGSHILFSPNSEYLALAEGYEKTNIRVLKTGSFEQIHDFTGHRLPIKTLVFTPDSQTLISGSEDLTIRLWEIEP